MSGAVTAAVGGAVVGGAISYLGSKKQAEAIGEAGDYQAEAQIKSQEMQLEFLREQREDIADAVDKGLISLEDGINAAIAALRPEEQLGAIQNYANLVQDPSTVFDRPGIQYQYDKGIEAMQAGFSRTAGGGVSGPTLVSAQEYGQNFAAMALDAELDRLRPLMDIETHARTSISNLEADRGRMAANIRMTGAAGIASATGQASQGMASSIEAGGLARGTEMIQKGNVNAALMSNLAQSTTDISSMIAFNSGLFSGGSPKPQAGIGYTPSR